MLAVKEEKESQLKIEIMEKSNRNSTEKKNAVSKTKNSNAVSKSRKLAYYQNGDHG